MRISRRELEARNRRQAARIDELLLERDTLERDANAAGYALEQCAGELSRMKEAVAGAIVHAGHPTTVVHDVRSFATSLLEELAANRVDLRLELQRLEGSDL